MGRERFLDHYRYAPEDLDELYALARQGGRRMPGDDGKGRRAAPPAAAGRLPLYYLRLEIEIIHGAADFDEAVGRICFPRDPRKGLSGEFALRAAIWPFVMIIDPRFTRLADGLAGFSTALKKGERVLIDAFDVPDAMVIALVRAARARGAYPYVQIHRARISRELALGADEAQYAPLAEVELARMRRMDAYIALRGSDNIFESSDVPADKVRLISRLMKPVLDHRVGKTKWVVLRWPTPAMAQQAGMSTEAFEDFYFRVCTLDYGRMRPGMKALAALMRRTDRVRIMGPGTDLRFSIKGIGAKECGGQYNIPDGEVFSCPVRDSVEGFVQFNAPTVYLGTSFDNVRLVFNRGRVVEARRATTGG